MIRSVPTLPGFPDPVQDAQATFRILLSALAHPGRIHRIPVKLDPPVGLNLSCAAACLSLLDLQTQVWTQSLTPEIKNWLGFHTGCRWNSDPQAAQFALIDEPFQMPTLDRFGSGTSEDPELSTTLLIQIENFERGEFLALTGAGIWEVETVRLPEFYPRFWRDWASNHQSFPLGVDLFLFSHDQMMGLPRTTQVRRM